ncbi:MAG: hypothetical protein IJU65_07815 [Desulfovibrio sp.]|nr:hypothetical protein [Desulfovibrio sp.]
MAIIHQFNNNIYFRGNKGDNVGDNKSLYGYTTSVSNGGEPPMDTRIDRLEYKVDGLEKSVSRLDATVSHIQNDMADMKTDMRAMRSDLFNLRYWIVGTVAAGIAIAVAVIGLQDMWYQKTLDRNWEIANKALDRIDTKHEELKKELKELANRPYQHP